MLGRSQDRRIWCKIWRKVKYSIEGISQNSCTGLLKTAKAQNIFILISLIYFAKFMYRLAFFLFCKDKRYTNADLKISLYVCAKLFSREVCKFLKKSANF